LYISGLVGNLIIADFQGKHYNNIERVSTLLTLQQVSDCVSRGAETPRRFR